MLLAIIVLCLGTDKKILVIKQPLIFFFRLLFFFLRVFRKSTVYGSIKSLTSEEHKSFKRREQKRVTLVMRGKKRNHLGRKTYHPMRGRRPNWNFLPGLLKCILQCNNVRR